MKKTMNTVEGFYMAVAGKTIKEIEIFNESGKHVLDLKKVLLQNKENPLIYNGLLSSISKDDYEKAVYESLIDVKVNEQKFEEVLISIGKYTNLSILKERYSAFQKKLSNALEKKGHKYFSSDSSPKTGGIVIIRKFGINLKFIEREFRLKEKEARKLLKDGFIEKYAQLKLKAITKDMAAKAEKYVSLSRNMKLETSKFYFNESHEVYNIDFNILISLTQKDLEASTTFINDLADKSDKILKFIEKEYYKASHGKADE